MFTLKEETALENLKCTFESFYDDLDEKQNEIGNLKLYLEDDIINRKDHEQPYYEQERELEKTKNELNLINEIIKTVDDRMYENDIEFEED